MANTTRIGNLKIINSRTWLALAVVVMGCLSFIMIRQSSNTVVIGLTWDDKDLISPANFDHQPWSDLLQKYVDDDGLVNYKSWKNNQTDLQKLTDYLESLSRVDANATISNDDDLAFWLNAYNALTVQAILRIYPIESVRRHANPLGFNIWNHYKIMVDARAYSLSDLMDGPLATSVDNRTRFGIVQGSVSCPKLARQAYFGCKVNAQLTDVVRRFFSDPRNIRVENEQRIHLSPVVRQVLNNLQGDTQQKLTQLSGIVPEHEAARLIQTAEICWFRHNWSLNQQ